MRIDGLTESDVKLLDTIWAIDTIDELTAFIARQPPNVRKRIAVLREMVVLAGIDEDVEDQDHLQSLRRAFLPQAETGFSAAYRPDH